jgi:hypothetical protein
MSFTEKLRAARKQHRRAVTVGITTFFLGALTLVRADKLTVDPGHVDAIADANNISHTVAVSADGQLSASDTGTQTRLDGTNTRLDNVTAAVGQTNARLAGLTDASGALKVDVGNQPATQNVSGDVNVKNFPPTQNVSGSIGVNNFPSVQNVNVTGGNSIAPTATSLGNGGYDLRNDFVSESDFFGSGGSVAQSPGIDGLGAIGQGLNGNGDINGLVNPGNQAILTSQRYKRIVAAPPGHPVQLTLIAINKGKGHTTLICFDASGHRMLHMNIDGDLVHEFTHPLQVQSCWLECFETDPNNGLTSLPQCEGNYTTAGL